MAEYLGGTADNSRIDFPVRHQMHQSRGGFPGTVEVAAHVGQAGGVFNIRIGGDHGDAFFTQLIDLAGNERIVIGGKHDAVHALGRHPVHGVQLGLQVEAHA